MYIEDLIIVLAQSGIKQSPFDVRLVISFYNQIREKTSFTEKQANLAISLTKKYKNKLEAHLSKNIDGFLLNPQFKQPFRVINNSKKITTIIHPEYKKALRVEFPYDDHLLTKFRQEKQTLDYAQWNPEEKTWIFSLDEKSIRFLSGLIKENGFTADDEFMDYVKQFDNIQENIEKYVPMVVRDNDTIKFVNISKNLPQNQSSDLLVSLFNARKLGIQTWSEDIERELDNGILKKFLKSDPGVGFDVDLTEHSLIDLKNIIKYLFPCLVVIPGGTELEKIQKSLELFNSLELTNSEMSVLFRLSSDIGKEFNNFVKENHLNSKISTNTKVIFISTQVPKTILESNIKFNSVLNFNFYNIHYKIRDFISWHHNVINILENTPQRRFNFALMQSSN